MTNSSVGTPQLKRAIQRGALVGAALALVEVVLTNSTGFAPSSDVVWILACDTPLSLGFVFLSLGLVAFLRYLGWKEPPALIPDPGLILAPVIVFALRGNVDPTQVHHEWAPALHWGLSLMVIVAVVVHIRRRVVLQQQRELSRYLLLSLLAQSSSVLGCALRTIDLRATRDIVVADISVSAFCSRAA